jgi:uncharacterized repeat protein (TIGR01451 family)
MPWLITPARGRRLRRGMSVVFSLALVAGLLAVGVVAAPRPADAAVSSSEQWITAVAGTDATQPSTLTFGTSGVTAALGARGAACSATNIATFAQLTSRQAPAFLSPSVPTNASGLNECVNSTTPVARTVTLNKPVVSPMLHINNLDGSTLTLDDATITQVSGNVASQVVGGNQIVPAANTGTANCSNTVSGNNPVCASYRLSQGSGPVTSFTMSNARKAAISGADGWYWTMSFHVATLTKAFGADTTGPGQATPLTFTITNPNDEGAVDLPGMGFTDTLPTGMTLASRTATTNGRCGAPVVNGGSPKSGDTSVGVTAMDVKAGDTCTITVDVKAGPGSYTNDNGNITTTVGNLVPSASDILTVEEGQGPPIFFGCSALVTFDEGPEGWRALSTTNGNTVNVDYGSVNWSATEGNPGGVAWSEDLDGQWSEMWTPPLGVAPNYYATDYTSAIGENLQFDYRNTTGIQYNVYVALKGKNGAVYFYNFRPQITNSQVWTRVLVPMDASKWQVGFNANGPTGAAPTSTQFSAALANVDRFAFSLEGRSGRDTTYFDNFGQSCDDYGDAPASYGTTAAANGPRHRPSGLDTGAGTATLSLGTLVDTEKDGQPSAGAAGDDTTGRDDEDAVTGPIVIRTGAASTIDVRATNATASPATLAGWVDLDGNGTFDAAERVAVAVPAGSGTKTYQLAFPAGTVTQDTYARFRLFDGDVTNPSPLGAVTGGEVEDHRVTVQQRGLEVEKSSDATSGTRVGDTVTYTLRATNVGSAAYTAAEPAVLLDDLSGVLDDATYNGDVAVVGDTATSAPSYAAPLVSWAGPLAAGASIELTYSVTLKAGGDGSVDNIAFAPTCAATDPSCATPTPTPACAKTPTIACESFDLPRLTVTKTADRTSLPGNGGQLGYTVTVKNEGPGDYTVDAPAAVTDDLSGVLDDATFDDDSLEATAGTPTRTGPALAWSGPLAAGDSAVITYSVTYDARKAGGDHALRNTACLADPGQGMPDEPTCAPADVPGAALQTWKTSDPADGTAVGAGDEITYTLHFRNNGKAAATVDEVDDLSGVLDDASVTSEPAAGDGDLEPARSDGRLAISGSVPAGEEHTVVYTVKVKAFSGQGDHDLANVVGTGTDCETTPDLCTSHPVRHLKVAKTSDAAAAPKVGDTITYSVTVTNDGTADYSADVPATMTDDLSKVVDDATFVADSVTVVGGGTAAFSSPDLTWSGPLEAGASATVTYQLKLTASGDGDVRNTACVAQPGEADPLCDSVVAGLPKLTIAKKADKTSLSADGQTVKYTVTVTNAGPGDYTAASPATASDDLSEVLDDGTVTTAPQATVGTALQVGGFLSWGGALASGQSAVITYSVTYDADADGGDHELTNTACVPTDQVARGEQACATVVVTAARLELSKTSDPASGPVASGDEITYTLHFANTGTAAATVGEVDDLSGVLDDAAVTTAPAAGAGDLEPTLTGGSLAVTGSVPAGTTSTVTYTVTVDAFADQGDHRLRNVLGAGTDCTTSPGLCTTHTVRQLDVVKTSDATADTRAGDTVTYSVKVTNVGTADYTAATPARVIDDLAEVLDDATWNADAAVSDGSDVTFVSPDLTWSGPLAAQQSVTVTYSVTLTGAGDGVVANEACVPNAGEKPTCDRTEHELPRLQIAKTSDITALPADGGVVKYTVSVTNPGPGDYTVTAPARVTDDLSDVLDDGTLDDDLASTRGADPVVTGGELTWSGALAAGQTVDLTYSVTYDARKAGGDKALENVACVPAEQAAPGQQACAERNVPGPALRMWKTSDPVTGGLVGAGQEITYTLHFENTGRSAAVIDEVDQLDDVLDDAEITTPAAAGAGDLVGVRSADRLRVTGSVPVGATYTVSYTVTVKAFADQGDHVIANVLGAGTDCSADPELCTRHEIPHLTVEKTSSATQASREGDKVTYTVTVANDGAGDFTTEQPATMTDDLSDVLDDAGWNADVKADAGAGLLTGSRLDWAGPLAAGSSAEITYSVTLTNAGDHAVRNTACVPQPGVKPSCDDTVLLLPKLEASKSVDPSSGSVVKTGRELTYTLRFANAGAAPATIARDDVVGGVLDDAQLVTGPTSSEPDLTVSPISNGRFSVGGDLAPGRTALVTYTVKVRPEDQRGDSRLVNFMVGRGATPPATCDPAAKTADCTTNPIAEMHDWKTADPVSGTIVTPGQRLTYTLHFRNSGTAPVMVDRVDDMVHVVDDAAIVAVPRSSDPSITVTGIDGKFTMKGTVQPGRTVTVTYGVRVRQPADQGDHVLANYLLDAGQSAPKKPVCALGPEVECTFNRIGNVTATKSVDPASGTDVEPGDRLTYTLTFTSSGEAASTVDHVDHMDGLLDDADLVSGPTTSGATLAVTTRRDELVVKGNLPPGRTATVRYAVEVKDYPDQGDHRLVNVLVGAGVDAADRCDADSPTCTENTAVEPDDDSLLPGTGGPAFWLLVCGLGLLVGGGAVVAAGRRRR